MATPTIKPPTRRRRRRKTQDPMTPLLKEARRAKVDFQRLLSGKISEALGVTVEVRLKGPMMSPATRKAARMSKTEVRSYLQDLLHRPVAAPR